MANISIGVNTGFAVNRYPVASEWLNVIEKSNLKKIQITADILDPRNPINFIEKEIQYISDVSRRGGPYIASAFTGAFTRLNLFGHSDQNVREYWFNWYKKFIDLSSRIGAKSIGGHLSIISLEDDKSTRIQTERLDHIIETWVILSKYAQEKGIPVMIWEPMSISREFGETILSAKYIQNKFDDKTKGAVKICLDVDHGDIMSSNPDDINPYKWIKEFSYAIDCIHLKQSSSNKSGHWPFIDKYNQDGKIKREKFIKFIKKNFESDLDLYLELSFRERNPVDQKAPEYISQSADYWLRELTL